MKNIELFCKKPDYSVTETDKLLLTIKVIEIVFRSHLFVQKAAKRFRHFSNQTMSEAEAQVFDVEIQMEEGEPLGATPNDKLIITKVQSGTLADGKLKIGDQVLAVNGQKIADTNTFFRALRFAPPVATLKVCRDTKKLEELEQRCHIPPDREKLIQRRDGYAYFVAKLVWQQGGPKLGLGIKHYQVFLQSNL